jgi:hypothetical protein
MLVALSGATFSHKIGDEAEFEDEEAQKFVDAKYAKYADEGGNNDGGAMAPIKALDKMTKDELLAYAEANGIEVTAEMTKAQILEAIQTGNEGEDNGGAE